MLRTAGLPPAIFGRHSDGVQIGVLRGLAAALAKLPTPDAPMSTPPRKQSRGPHYVRPKPRRPGYWPSGSAFNALAPKPGPGRCGPADDASTVICRVCPAVLAGPETANRLDARPVTPAAKQEQSTFCVPPPVAPRSEVPDLSALFRQFERIAAPRTSVANLSKISVITP